MRDERSPATDGEVHITGMEMTDTPRSATRRIMEAMVNRFLAWKLPEDFHPDAGISFSPHFNVEYNAKRGLPPQRHDPIGTNLLTATQAEEMLAHVTAPLQAELDRLMLEFCPEEMDEAQKANWAKHQRAATPEEEAAVQSALSQSRPMKQECIDAGGCPPKTVCDTCQGVVQIDTEADIAKGEFRHSYNHDLSKAFAPSSTREPDWWYGEDGGWTGFTKDPAQAERWKTLGSKVTPLYAASAMGDFQRIGEAWVSKSGGVWEFHADNDIEEQLGLRPVTVYIRRTDSGAK